MRNRDRTERRERSRAQTTIDFAVGVGIFLLAVAWVVGTVPQILQPFDSGQEQPLVANRAADTLARDVLGETGEPNVLDETCTDAFFDGDPEPTGCHYGDPDPREATGIGGSYGMNVTLVRNGSVVAATGEPVPSSKTIVAARRSVLYDGSLHYLAVRVW